MNINITGKDFELTDAIKSYINEKIGKLSKYIGDEFEATATLKMDGNKQVAEVRVSVSSQLYKAVTASKDLYASIDKDIEILEGQIRKTKAKKDKQNKSESIKFTEAQKDDDSEEEGEIIKSIYYSIKPLTEEDAMLILKSDVKNKFLPFINVNTNKVNVVYKLKDGKNFGILEPEE
ncbi:MAG: ribosome-associated translation inhibitor RaiA [Clostridia bacterium]|nr:ribosome-associated translation inhibitor RaiA [Clostridia bacterium]